MDMNKLCEKLLQKPEIKDIPLVFVFKVACAVFDVINEGECFYDTEETKCMSNGIQTLLEEE